MNNLWAVFYGFIQGVTEFLPVSSSGHLALIPYFFKLEDPGVFFDLMMHLGTAIAVILYFRQEIKILIIQFYLILKNRTLKDSPYVFNFLLSTFFSFLLILVLKKYALDFGRSSLLIGINFIVFGVLMYFSDRSLESNDSMVSEISFKKSILIGLSQSIAIFPGVSRSGATLTTSRFLGLSRIEASRFSFLLSLPVILGSIVFKLPDIINGSAVHTPPLVMLIGILSSFLFGIVTIHFFLKLISKVGLVYFSVYRLIIGSLLIYLSIYSA